MDRFLAPAFPLQKDEQLCRQSAIAEHLKVLVDELGFFSGPVVSVRRIDESIDFFRYRTVGFAINIGGTPGKRLTYPLELFPFKDFDFTEKQEKIIELVDTDYEDDCPVERTVSTTIANWNDSSSKQSFLSILEQDSRNAIDPDSDLAKWRQKNNIATWDNGVKTDDLTRRPIFSYMRRTNPLAPQETSAAAVQHPPSTTTLPPAQTTQPPMTTDMPSESSESPSPASSPVSSSTPPPEHTAPAPINTQATYSHTPRQLPSTVPPSDSNPNDYYKLEKNRRECCQCRCM